MKKNLILGVVLVVLLAAIFVPRILPPAKNYPDTLGAVDSAAVDYMHIVFKADSITLVKSGEDWFIDGSPRHPADPAQVGRVLQQCQKIDVIARTSDNKDLVDDTRFGLDADNARFVELRQGAKTVLDARFGKGSADFSNGFARLEGKEPVYRTASNLGSRFAPRRSIWLQKQLFNMNPDTLRELSLTHADGSREHYRWADSLWVGEAFKANGSMRFAESPLNESAFKSLLSGVARFRVTDLAPDSLVAGVDMASPELSASFSDAGGGQHTVAWYRSPKAENRLLCRVSGQDSWYETYSGSLDPYKKDPAELLQK
ncbi:MAG: DUF4340 domain-containing protein [Candidatus Delongbacteria bacterium]|nr:DUF4340 domain-containing protein [Candidatus Delongbacteria bacterium]